jgi:diguanylate cyclase (GGDEF)-like protein
LLAAGVICVAFIIVFVASGSGLANGFKILIFALSTAFAVLVFYWTIAAFKFGDDGVGPGTKRSISTARLEKELAALEEAAVFFSASIKTKELVNLLRVRLDDVLTNCETHFLLFDSGGELFEPDAKAFMASPNLASPFEERLALAEIAANRVRVAHSTEITGYGADDSGHIHSSAVPLFRGTEPFSVLVVSAREKHNLPEENELQTISERLAPLISGSISFESSVSNALTDNLTQLPNERAMYLILESQIAEAQRFGVERPLSLLAVDINSFEETNKSFGHSEGDKMLTFAANELKTQLRQMDFLARTSDDEFVVILPTVSSAKIETVVNRIKEQFEKSKYACPDGNSRSLELSYGGATFGDDGQTAAELLRCSTERKRVQKSSERGSMLRFPDGKKV